MIRWEINDSNIGIRSELITAHFRQRILLKMNLIWKLVWSCDKKTYLIQICIWTEKISREFSDLISTKFDEKQLFVVLEKIFGNFRYLNCIYYRLLKQLFINYEFILPYYIGIWISYWSYFSPARLQNEFSSLCLWSPVVNTDNDCRLITNSDVWYFTTTVCFKSW